MSNTQKPVSIVRRVFVAEPGKCGGLFHNRFSDALEAAGDQDLRWRCTFLTAVSLALGDRGDSNAALAKAALGLEHAEALAQREGETAAAARRVLNEVGWLGGGVGSAGCLVAVAIGAPDCVMRALVGL